MTRFQLWGLAVSGGFWGGMGAAALIEGYPIGPGMVTLGCLFTAAGLILGVPDSQRRGGKA